MTASRIDSASAKANSLGRPSGSRIRSTKLSRSRAVRSWTAGVQRNSRTICVGRRAPPEQAEAARASPARPAAGATGRRRAAGRAAAPGGPARATSAAAPRGAPGSPSRNWPISPPRWSSVSACAPYDSTSAASAASSPRTPCRGAGPAPRAGRGPRHRGGGSPGRASARGRSAGTGW